MTRTLWRPIGVRRRRGLSLIEVLAAMAILVLGILAVLRIFPQGFTTVRYGENSMVAGSLTRAFEEYLRAHALQLPDGVAAVRFTGPATYQYVSNLDPRGTLAEFFDPRLEGPDPRRSVLNQVRRILGETFVVPPPVSNSPYVSGGSVSIYTLLFGPVYTINPIPGHALGISVYSGTPLRMQPVGEALDITDPYDAGIVNSLDLDTAAIHYDTATLYFRPVPYARVYRIEFRFDEISGGSFTRLETPPDSCILVPAGAWRLSLQAPTCPPGCPCPPAMGTSGGVTRQLVRGSERLYRVFDQLLPAQPFSVDNPYQYKVLNPVLGVLGFNPLGAQIAHGADEQPGLLVKVDYDVDDWLILREDVAVPSDSPYVVKLAVPGIKRARLESSTGALIHSGDLEEWPNLPIAPASGGFTCGSEPTFEYWNLIRCYPERPAPMRFVDVLVHDQETGLVLDSTTLQGGLNGRIDYDRGEIEFNRILSFINPADPTNPGAAIQLPAAGRNLRIYYRARLDWGVSLTKAFDRYAWQPNPCTVSYREYGVLPNGFLVFPSSDAEKTILIDYEWVQAGPGGSRITHTVIGEQQTIRSPTDLDSPQLLYNAGSLCAPLATAWWARTGNAPGTSGSDLQARPDCLGMRILAVRGASIHTHVVWREGAQWRQRQAVTILRRDRP